MKQIFPKEIIKNTVEVHQFKHSNKSKIIYSIILLGLIAALISLPFINVTIYNTSQGVVKPDKERINLQAITSGKVIFQNLENNKAVKKGDTLLVISNNTTKHKIANNDSSIEENTEFIEDLETLLKNRKPKKSLKYQQEYFVFRQKQRELQTRFKKLKDDYTRNTNLFNKGVIAKVSLENTKLEYDLALNAIYQYKKQQQNNWQGQLINTQNNLKDLESNETQLKENKALNSIKSPISGVLLNVKRVEIGSFVHTGLQLAEISPNTDLLVECYITPTDIGLLKKGDKVKFQIAAFNYNQWGLATGKITQIANDVQIINNTPVFKIHCSLDANYLKLTNGFKGYLKKGMTLNARFKLAERSLFDLLYDKMDDWLNPTNQIAKN